MEWYVLNYDFNNKKVVSHNIFNNISFIRHLSQYIDEYEKGILSYKELKESIRSSLRGAFWSRREYELSIGDAFETDLDKYEKIDVYRQVLPNLDLLVKYILDNKEYLQK